MTPTDTTDAPAPDEIALPRFEDALWSALRTEHARTRRARRRGVAGRRVVAVAAAVAVIAGGGVLAASHGRRGATIAAGPTSPSSQTEATTTTAPLTIEERAAAAMLARADDSVVGDTVGGPVPYTQWTDGLTHTERTVYTGPDGRVLGEQGMTELTDLEAEYTPGDPLFGIAVNHCDRTVIRGQEFNGGTILSWLGSDMERGLYAADGTEVIDGRELIRLRTWAEEDMPAPDPETDRWDPPTADAWDTSHAIYLDPETLMPVLSRSRIGQPDESRVVHTVLPRTDETLANVLVTDPVGYTELPSGEWVVPIAGVGSCA